MLTRDADYAFYLYTCNRCRGCTVDRSAEHRPVCPSTAKFGFFSYSGGGKGYVAQGILEGKVKPTAETLDIAMNCLLCGACAHMCPPGFETVSFIRDLRDHLVRKGMYFNPEHQAMLDNVLEHGNPWGIVRQGNHRHSDLRAAKDGAQVAVYTGCRDRLKMGSLDNVIKILDRAGVSYGLIPDETCCGGPLLNLGKVEEFEEIAQKNIEKLNALGAERILALCPHCINTLTNEYMNQGDLEPEVVSVPAFVNELIAEEKIELLNHRAHITATYHDPCYLGRFVGEYDPPREALGSVPGLELIEMERSGESALCCGAGGWMQSIVPELSRFAGRERVREAIATGADSIITACSFCAEFLSRQAGKDIKVQEFSDFIAKRLK